MSRLKKLRKEHGFTQIKMQHLTGIDQSDYSKIENGKRYYTFEQCRKIALALNTSISSTTIWLNEPAEYSEQSGFQRTLVREKHILLWRT